jgi:hypothetical protein
MLSDGETVELLFFFYVFSARKLSFDTCEALLSEFFNSFVFDSILFRWVIINVSAVIVWISNLRIYVLSSLKSFSTTVELAILYEELNFFLITFVQGGKSLQKLKRVLSITGRKYVGNL